MFLKIVLVTVNDIDRNTVSHYKDLLRKEDRSAAEIDFDIVPVNRFYFSRHEYVDCYIFESDQAMSPWVIDLGRYLPPRRGERDWTTTYEVLNETGSDPSSDIGVVCQLIGQGKVVPLEPFAVTWLFMRRSFTELFSYEACEKVGCDNNLRGRIITTIRKDLGGDVSIERFLDHQESWWRDVYGMGPKKLAVILEILKLYRLKFAER